MSTARAALPALFVLVLVLAGCQVPVRPDQNDPPEPATPITVTPVPRLPPPPVVPEPTPPPAAVVPDPMDTGAEVFDRMTARFSAPICVKGQQNRTWRRKYAGYPSGFARHLEEILPLMAYVVEEIERKDLPGEFALLPIVESWYRPAAMGPGGPAGMWQMISSTARNHGIRIQPGYDGRLSPVESTDAALSYLQTLSGMFDGEWRAMAMAYNAGEYRIIRAFRTSGDRRVSGESQLPRGLSRTTYAYVAKLHALACLISKPERHGLELPREARFVPLARRTLAPGVQSLDQAAIGMATDASRLRALNPAYRQGRVVAGAPRDVLVPATALASLASDAPAVVGGHEPTESGRVHRVSSGDTLSRIASKYGVALKDLFRLNGLSGKSILRVGQQIRLTLEAPHRDHAWRYGPARFKLGGLRCRFGGIGRRRMGFLSGKRALVVGVASQRSIASGIADAMYREGAEMAFTYQTDKLKSRVEDAARECGSSLVMPLDVGDDAQIDSVFAELAKHWDGFDILVHSVGFAPREALEGGFLDNLTRENFRIAHDISSYSLAALAKAARPMMKGRNGSILTLSYLGAERALASYNVMGLAKASLEANVRYLAMNLGPEGTRVNAISAGPIKTLAASGVGHLRKMLAHVAETAPLRRNVTIENVGNVGAFLCSDLAAGVTGEITYVDCGYNILGMTGLVID